MIGGFFGTIYTLWLYVSWLPFYLTQYDKYWGRGRSISNTNGT